jgi:hypothetical protein
VARQWILQAAWQASCRSAHEFSPFFSRVVGTALMIDR